MMGGCDGCTDSKGIKGNALIRTHSGVEITGKQFIVRVIIASGLLTVFLLARFRAPEQILFPPCAFKTITGLGCLTCGMTHSFHALAQGQIIEAFRYHLMGPPLFLVFAFFLLKTTVELIGRKQIRINVHRTAARIALIIILVVWFGFWMVRLYHEAGLKWAG